jgi:hypothetical protein
MAVRKMMDDLPYGPIAIERIELRLGKSIDGIAQHDRRLSHDLDQVAPAIGMPLVDDLVGSGGMIGRLHVRNPE